MFSLPIGSESRRRHHQINLKKYITSTMNNTRTLVFLALALIIALAEASSEIQPPNQAPNLNQHQTSADQKSASPTATVQGGSVHQQQQQQQVATTHQRLQNITIYINKNEIRKLLGKFIRLSSNHLCDVLYHLSHYCDLLLSPANKELGGCWRCCSCSRSRSRCCCWAALRADENCWPIWWKFSLKRAALSRLPAEPVSWLPEPIRCDATAVESPPAASGKLMLLSLEFMSNLLTMFVMILFRLFNP